MVVTSVKNVKVRQTKPNGFIAYRGPSKFNGKPIVVVVTGIARKSKNPKTGDEIQTWILPDEGLDPIAAAAVGGEVSVCGHCVHRPVLQPDGAYKLGSCYVNLIFGPLEIWKSLRDGRYPEMSGEHLRRLRGRKLRLGAYGDPAAVPMKVWHKLAKAAAGAVNFRDPDAHRYWTGYTHAWRTCSPSLRRYCMASCETEGDVRLAWSRGWRTFRVRLEEQSVMTGEFVCPASEEGGKRKTCEECGACSGTLAGGRNASPVIIFHASRCGGNWKQRIYRNTMEQLLREEQEEGGRRINLPLI